MLQDTAGNEAGAINAFQTLISQNVVGIVGPTLSQQAFAADPIAGQAKVPVLAPSNTAAGIPEIGDFSARVSSGIAVVAPNAVEKALELNPDIAKVAVFFAQNDAFSKSETEVFQKTVTEKGLEITTVQTFQTTDTDFTAQATNALGTHPDLAIVSGWPQTAATSSSSCGSWGSRERSSAGTGSTRRTSSRCAASCATGS